MKDRNFIVAGVALLAILGLSACGSSDITNQTQTPQKGSTTTAPDPVPSNKADEPELSFQHFTVLREFKNKDTAALFVILPNQGQLLIVDVSGPAFLGAARVGSFDKTRMDHFFLKGSTPMPQSEKDSIVSKFNGGQAIYFENYNGNLCDGPDSEFQITVSSLLGGTKVTTTFDFTAVPTSSGDCKFHTISSLDHF